MSGTATKLRDSTGKVYPLETAIGLPADAEQDTPSASASMISLLKGILAALAGVSTINITASVQLRGAFTDRSGTITLGNASQQLAPIAAGRKFLIVQNLDASEDLWINFTTDAVKDEPSIKIAAGASMRWDGSFIPTEKVTVIALTTGHKFAAKEG